MIYLASFLFVCNDCKLLLLYMPWFIVVEWVSLVLIVIEERTQKVKMGSIKAVVSEPIEGHEEYHVLVSFVNEGM